MKPAIVALAAFVCASGCSGGKGNASGNATAPAAANQAAESSGLAAAPAQNAAPNEPLVGRCHMGGCSWFRIDRRETVREADGERLLRVTIVEGGSEHRDNAYPENSRGVAIQWSPATSDTHFLCSATRPTAILPKEGSGWEAIQLDFVNGPFGATEAVSAQYVAACHPGEDMNRPGFADRHRYRASETAAEPFDLARPEDIFDRRG